MVQRSQRNLSSTGYADFSQQSLLLALQAAQGAPSQIVQDILGAPALIISQQHLRELDSSRFANRHYGSA
jgi:hypothetical protein